MPKMEFDLSLTGAVASVGNLPRVQQLQVFVHVIGRMQPSVGAFSRLYNKIRAIGKTYCRTGAERRVITKSILDY